jgi:hypothetical protein
VVSERGETVPKPPCETERNQIETAAISMMKSSETARETRSETAKLFPIDAKSQFRAFNTAHASSSFDPRDRRYSQ